MTLTLRVCFEDWYVIERAEHDGRQWLQPVPGGARFMTSARFSDADVEGTAAEMRSVADAIRRRDSYDARRVAVVVDGDEVRFWSPRNSDRPGIVTYTEALDLAGEIDRVLS